MNIYLLALILSIAFLLVTLKFINTNSKSQLIKSCSISIFLMILWCLGLIFQILLSSKLNILPICFEYFICIGPCFLPIAVYFICKIYTNTKIKFNKKYLLLFIIPMLTLLTLWTNNFHHLLYKKYSININETKFGPFFTIHTIYEYIILGISLYRLLKFSIKNSGFFSKQSILIIIAILIPVIANVLGTLQIISMTIYVTPICFTFSIILVSIAIFKFNFLKTAPIALQKIVDRISDAYIVLDENNIVTDFNKTFLTTFNISASDIRGKKILDILEKSEYTVNVKKLKTAVKKAHESEKTQKLTETFSNIEKVFTIEISNLTSQGNFIGIVVLFKDITQHVQDMETIKNNQDMLIERERLASLGQMIGGIAHNLKTPIFSVAGGLEGLTELINEYDNSIGNPVVTESDYHAIAGDMREWIVKMKKHVEYMSDVITAVKGQAVTFSEENAFDFSISELFKHVDILMKHELKNAIVSLYIDNKVEDTTVLHGNINGLVQVINNLISNAIYAYQGKENQVIDLSAKYIKSTNIIQIRVKDYGPGLPQEIQDRLFKEMVTTKGKDGTGLGLFMSASNIRAQFNGNLTFETQAGKGTTFIIDLPVPVKQQV